MCVQEVVKSGRQEYPKSSCEFVTCTFLRPYGWRSPLCAISVCWVLPTSTKSSEATLSTRKVGVSMMARGRKKMSALPAVLWPASGCKSSNVMQFHHRGWPAIEHFAAQGLVKGSIWNARLSWLGVKARIHWRNFSNGKWSLGG